MKKFVTTLTMLTMITTIAFAGPGKDKIQIENKSNYEVKIEVTITGLSSARNSEVTRIRGRNNYAPLTGFSPSITQEPIVKVIDVEKGFNEIELNKRLTRKEVVDIKILSNNEGLVDYNWDWDGDDVYITIRDKKVILLRTKVNKEWRVESITLDEIDNYEVIEFSAEQDGYRHYELKPVDGTTRMKIMTNDDAAIFKLNSEL